jgi:DNA-binding HxlR family transcriptional regulator
MLITKAMTQLEFNEKYSDYIEEGFWGLEFNIPIITEYLDKLFQEDLIHREGFKFSQIKVKFNWLCFYADGITREEQTKFEQELKKLYEKYLLEKSKKETTPPKVTIDMEQVDGYDLVETTAIAINWQYKDNPQNIMPGEEIDMWRAVVRNGGIELQYFKKSENG